MVIGRINFSSRQNNSLKFLIEDFFNSALDYTSIISRNVYICKNCGVMLAPFINLMGPRAAGMKKVNKGYLCHFCNDHYSYCSTQEIEERMIWVEESNTKTNKKILFFKMLYPWARVRYK